MKHSISIRPLTCIVKKNEWGDFEVPTQKGLTGADSIYYADDKQDAIDTARYVHGQDVKVIVRKGTYGIEEA